MYYISKIYVNPITKQNQYYIKSYNKTDTPMYLNLLSKYYFFAVEKKNSDFIKYSKGRITKLVNSLPRISPFPMIENSITSDYIKINSKNIKNLNMDQIINSIENYKKSFDISKYISKENYISDGKFSNVYKNGNRIWKIYKKTINIENIEQVSDEIHASNKIDDNKYFAKFYGAFLVGIDDLSKFKIIKKNKEDNNSNGIYLVLEYEYINGITFANLCKEGVYVNYETLLKSIKNSIKYLNQNKIVRYDNHLNNIMVDNLGNIKYIDMDFTEIKEISKNKNNKEYMNLLISIYTYILNLNNRKNVYLLIAIFSEIKNTIL